MPSKRKAVEAGESPSETALRPSSSASAAAAAAASVSASAAVQLPVKRQRVSRACDQCRAAREKCDGVQPLCFPCVSQNRPCTYEVSPKKRGVQTGYIRTLELALAWVFETVAGSEDALNAAIAHEGGPGQILLAGKDPGGADRLHKKWRKSRVHKGIDRILSGGGMLSPRDDKRSPSEDASDTDGDIPRPSSAQGSAALSGGTVLEPPSTALDSPGSTAVHPGRDPLTPGEDGRLATKWYPTGASCAPYNSPGRLKLLANHWRLLDIYFSYTHSWFPILQKQDLYQTSYLYSDQGLAVSPDNPSSAAHAELWSALALASFQDTASSNNTSSGDVNSGFSSPSDIYDIARGLVPSENGPFQIQHVRALLLLSLVSLGRGNPTSAWILAGMAIRVFFDIGTPHQPIPNRQQERLQAAFIACFMVDTIVSLRHNKPPHLKTEDVADVLPIPEDGLDQWEPWAPCDGFGSSHVVSRVARNPAYCLSTFNQLYGILKVVGKEMSRRRRGPGGFEHGAAFTAELEQAMNLSSPFGAFTTSPDIGSALVPTAYLVRAVYFWARALADPRIESYSFLVEEALDQYETRFGACGMPPFIPACLVSLASPEDSTTDFVQHHQDRLAKLLSAYSSVWSYPGRPPTGILANSQPTPVIPQPTSLPNATDPNLFPPSVHSIVPFAAPTSSSSFYGNTTMPKQSPLASRGYLSFDTPRMITSYQQPTTVLGTPSSALVRGSGGVNIEVEAHTTPMGAAGVEASQHPQHPHHAATRFSGFASAPIDYDALLDDLALIDCTDGIDADPQFMANLGFAPGCDLTDILTREFGTI
ncbi:fungal-specific transcription factor domain-containing protein [Diplogelasinospora grovesii]|uniref:Fungal-specific transcription factor domain-containing protein n=1 Tax=Diplogelasinospora grovesii TaxID=303347 RepID=A0AAN6MYI3_9PEZI|nr:fungal-specific transcription factor domain-containing protein [Diplogelasinospora grovesii]